ncbi:type I polyketide synthase [Streptomyces sp. DH41]|uniref:type I polyketide synthase n=1 Tax=Streptomyces sp. DH41 TaxID=3040125 RepID=UPI002442BE38|nr:beta-ketoacyl synthase N-terminal-like domain-containing protein [Streptomyces sp. DH41]MDG9722697.1 beta-ketoacyl synthase N-terminal-like domain-containing protein [Streptomyces sp. DH41]
MSGAAQVAVIGTGCRFPGANGVEEFWRLLVDNTDAVGPVPGDRFDIGAHYAPQPGVPGRTVSRHGGFLDDLYGFDAAFFGIAPREALAMDPQQRLLLHVVWEALEEAGVRPSSLAGTATGVFVGQATADYGDQAGDRPMDVHGMAGARLRAVTAGRVSFALDLRGPSLVVDTACSSSLVAVHLARQSLLSGESDLAVAAGVNAILSPADAVTYSQGGMLAPDGRCKFADASGDGFVRSEGVGAVLLKRLDDALRDGDPVLAVLRGSSVTNDGAGSGLLLQPAVAGQTHMIRAACRSAGITPGQVDYLEAHGTGTRVGDEVELRTLADVLREDPTADRALRVGSVKTNIGHAEAAAGIAGLIKTVLIARHGLIPASLHQRSPHPVLTEPDVRLEAVTRNTPLEPAGPAAVLGVSSFGLSGTNAQVIVGSHPQAVSAPTPSADHPEGEQVAEAPELLVLSARSAASLRRLAQRYAAHLERGGRGRAHRLSVLCRAAATRRDSHPHRLWAVATTHDAMAGALRALARGEETADGGLGEAPFHGGRRIAFVFPGQGAQWRGMGRRLLEHDADFRRAMTECDAAVRAELGWSVIETLTGEDAAREAEPWEEVAVAQPLLWAVQVSLAAALRARGAEPGLCLGHSMGEVAAARTAGALSVRDAAAVICRRSRLMTRLAGRGAMLVVELGPDAAAAAAAAASHAGAVCVAARNAPRSTVLAGDTEALRSIAARLEEDGVFCRLVKVDVASHSPVMDELREDLLTALAGITPRHGEVDMLSTVRCAPVDGAELDAAYWADNLREPVRFMDAVRGAAEAEETVFVEISPHPLLTQAVAATLEERGEAPSAVVTLKRRQPEPENLLRALGRIFACGGRVDWDRCFRTGDQGPEPFVPLPTYAWDLEEFRREAATAPADRHSQEFALRDLGLPALGGGVRGRGPAAVPPVVYLEAVRRAALDVTGGRGEVLSDIEFGSRPLELGRAGDATVRVDLTALPGQDAFAFTVTAGLTDGGDDGDDGAREGDVLLSGRLRTARTAPDGEPERDRRPGSGLLDDALTRCGEYVPADEFYRRTRARGLEVDDPLRTAAQAWLGDGECVARMRGASGTAPAAALEAALVTMAATWPRPAAGGPPGAFLPVSFGRVHVADPGALATDHWSLARWVPGPEAGEARCDVRLVAPDGHLIAEFLGTGLRPLPSYGTVATSSGTGGAVPGVTAHAASPRPAATGTVRPYRGVRPHEPARPLRARHGQTGTTAPAPSQAPERAVREADVLRHTATVLGISVSRLDPRRPLRSLGLDSLLATELRVRLNRSLGVDVTAQRLLGPEPVGEITASLADSHAETADTAGAAETAASAALVGAPGR